MSTVWEFVLLGLSGGGLYGLSALGLVLIYRGSGVINFAHGAVGMVGTFAYYELYEVDHWGFLAAFVPSVALSGVIGILIQLLVMRPLRNASGLTRLLATLGVLTTLQGLVVLHYNAQLLVVGSSLPLSTIRIFGTTIGKNRIILFGIVLLLGIILSIVYKFSRFGLATSAVAENPRASGHLGYSPGFIASANWAVGSMLAAVAGILLAPLTGLSVAGLTLLVIPALAAAVVGDMVSFPITLAAGIFIGVLQSEMTRFVHNQNIPAAVPIILIVVVLMVRGTTLPTRGTTSSRLPSVGTGRLRPWLILPALGGILVLLETLPEDWVIGISTTLVVGVVVLSVVVVTGYAGQVSLVQWVLAGVGALIAANLVAHHHVPFLAALIIAALSMIPIGVAIGLPAVRTRGDQLAIVTLGVGVAIQQIVFGSVSLAGLNVGFPKIFGIHVDQTLHPRNYGILVTVAFFLMAIVVANLRRGRSGLRLLALRSNERAAASLGISVAGGKLYAFALSSVIAAVGGVLYAFSNASVGFSNFTAFNSVPIVGFSVIGGLGYVAGPLFGSTLQPGAVGTNVGDQFGSGFQPYLVVIGGVLLIITLVSNVDGVAASTTQQFWWVVGKLGGRGRASTAEARRPALSMEKAVADRPIGTVLVTPRPLVVSDLSVRFGSTSALQHVDLDVKAGQIVGLIGPNGAGKTTLIDAVTGYVKPASGTIVYGGLEVRGKQAHMRARGGIARSYQSLELFDDLTVLENLTVAGVRCHWWNYVTDLVYPGKPQVTEAMIQAIRTFGLEGVLQKRPTDLPYGQRRLIAIARAVAAEPSVLLLDEPAAGLSETERHELGELIRFLAIEKGIAVLLIEHDVDLVMRLCDRIVTLDFGQVVAAGTPDEIRADPAVIAAYLGAETSDAPAEAGGPDAESARATQRKARTQHVDG